jgi:para-aminobenzoate synthetase component I
VRPGLAYEALLSVDGPCALLESTTTGGSSARSSILAKEPRAIVVADRRSTLIHAASGTREIRSDPMQALRDVLRETPDGRWPDEGGVVGALAYDFARPDRSPAPTPLLVALAVDRFDVYESGRDAEAASAQASLEPAASRVDLAAFSSLSREEHGRLVARIKAHVAAGDIYQANLSQRFRLPWTGTGLALYGNLRRLSPAPFSGYLRAPGLEIVSASPERLLRVEGRSLSTRPIAGTRPRSADPRADRALAEELLLSEKERAEHLMLLDLARNDLGKVAVVGSVHVDEMMTVEHYAHVRHIVSNVSARLAPGCDPLDALLAMFPGGTITGVPKIRCMEILDALEPVPRGFYTGSLFYMTPSGRLDANILIRSAVVEGGAVTFHTGGGIVADSDPDAEYAETLHKAEGMRAALEATGVPS